MQLSVAIALCCFAVVAAQYGGDDTPAAGPMQAPAPAYGGGGGGYGGGSMSSGGGSMSSGSGSKSSSGGMKKHHRRKMGGQASSGQTSRGGGYGAAGQTMQAAAADVPQMTAVEAANAAINAAVAQGANRNNFGIQSNAHYTVATSKNAQNPVVWDALDSLRGKAALSMEDILNIMYSAVAGQDYPIYNDIPNTGFACESVKQAGFYADTEAQCQVIRRCDINGVMWSYLCPNMTLFNQITLVCDYFYNIDCSKAKQFYDYSNPRLYTEFVLLDDGESRASSSSSSGSGYGMRPAAVPSYDSQPSYKPAKSSYGAPAPAPITD